MVNRNQLPKLLLGVSLGLLLFSLSGLIWLNWRIREASSNRNIPLPVLTHLPDFRLIETSGTPFGLADLKDKIWVADFIFTRCPGPCPRMSARMAELLRRFAAEPSVRLVSISVDPEFDTPEILSRYGATFHADENRWIFLTGEKAEIHRLAKSGFLVGGVDDVMMHSTRFILVDRNAQVRGYYDSADEQSLQGLVRDIGVLVAEKPL